METIQIYQKMVHGQYNFCSNDSDHPDVPACYKEDGALQRLFLQMIWIKNLLQRGRCITTTFLQMIWINSPVVKMTVH